MAESADQITQPQPKPEPKAKPKKVVTPAQFSDEMLRKYAIEFFGTFPSGTGAQFQLRTAPDSSGFPGTFGPWLGPTGGDFYTDPNGATAINPAHADGVADRFVQYRAILYSTSTLAAPNISSVTISFNVRPASPTISALVAISSEAIVLTTVDQSINEDEIIVSMGLATLPTVEGLVIPTLDKPGTGTVQISTIAGFAPNTQIFVRTRARNTADALDSVFSNEFSTFTLANEPISVGSLLVFGTSFTVSWNPNSNPAGTLYEVSLSTDNFNLNITTPVVFSDGLTGNTTDMVSLAGGTTYYVRVRARNQDLIETAFSAIFSTATRVSPITGLSGTGVGVSSVVFSWNSSGPSAQYRIFSATAGVLLATVQTASVAVTGLLTNSTFSIQVEPFNAVASAGLSEPATAFSQAAIPSALSAISLSSGSISLSWNASANPTGTPFKLLYSTDVFQTITTTAALFSNNFTGLTTTYVKLAVGTTHTFRISAQNGDGLDSPSIDIATQTFPGTVSAVTGVGLGVSSIAWNWTNSAGPTVEFYSIVRGSTGIEIATTAATTFNDTGLLPNTTFGLRIRAVNLTGPGALPAETTTHTLAQPPTATAIFVVFIDSITVSWSTNLNPSKTVYEVERSTDNAQFSLVAASAAASLIDLNLSGGTTYYYRVRAFNTPGIATDFDAVVSTFLAGKIPEPPIGFSARSLSGGRIHLSWTISPSTTVNTYNVYFDSGTGVIDYSVLFASVSIPTTSFNTVPLSIGTSYFFGLRAENEKNEEESNIHVVAAAVAIAAPAALVASIRAPPPGATIAGDHITLRAGLDEGTPFDVSQILFEFREVGVGGWTTVAAVDGVHPNPAVSEPFLTHWDTTGLTADGSFDLRAIARDGSGVDDPFPPSVRVRVSNTLPDVSENKGPGSQVIKRVRVHSFTETTLDVADGSGRFMLSVTFSSAATTGTEDILRIDTDPAFKPVFSSSFSPTGLISQITLESGQTNLNAGRTATISFSHLDKNSDNRVDGTSVRVDNLRIAVFDPILNEWILEIPSSISSKDETTLTGTTPHFSLFAVVSPAAAGLSEVRIYPNPFRPNNNIDNDGKPWTVGDQTSGIIFDGLPPSGEIRVYSVSGLLVWRSPGPTAGGLLRWDTKNGDGVDVASGIYFAVITDSAGNKTGGKLAVIR
ncbi:MAG: hypothetical protein COB53_05425 [Elusimicrobia bacterium]|nr:MAG: hypothetical protein COB53_05425 [Elusimicrobiota bacterium]